MSLLRKILRVEKPNPVTEDELKQLELQAKKAELQARIQKAKAEGPSVFSTIQKIIGKSNNNPFDMTPRKRSDYDPFRM